ncbi:hypothetical protein ACO2D6_004289 [Escherichia coli]|mgnify:CR=1 FL=1|uniref:Uncharacterized protein n=1 Tax=Escherichia coli TaxID=562 RepID=A0A2S8JPP2_ECOLX|nr:MULTISPECIES: hypothetical protein [Enterobacteriaceae]EFN8536113.1 hypothetical protein [Escherichia coli O1]MBU4625485.1 hypothetical protein [Shigella sp. GCP5]HCC75849.1 hypothetical protein [Shigella sp.]HDQ6873377.1 hypothetical protein [Escherichia coli O166:H28]EAC1497685.1 hypothetical protein [Escherichia coli]
MQTQLKVKGGYSHFFFANIEVSQRESNGGLVVVRDVNIPITTTTLSLLENYAVGQVLTLEQKNGDFFDVYYVGTDGNNFQFSTHC